MSPIYINPYKFQINLHSKGIILELNDYHIESNNIKCLKMYLFSLQILVKLRKIINSNNKSMCWIIYLAVKAHKYIIVLVQYWQKQNKLKLIFFKYCFLLHSFTNIAL